MRITGAGRFFRNPVRQLRDFGASTPSTSFRRNVSPSVLISRQPVTVTGAGSVLAVDVVATEVTASGAAALVAGSSCLGGSATAAAVATDAGDVSRLTRFVTGFTAGFFGGASMRRGVSTIDAAARAVGTGVGGIR